MGQEQHIINREAGTQLPDIVNRVALGMSALTISTTTMFTALAVHTQQDKPALIFGTSLAAQALVATFTMYRMFKSPTTSWGALARMTTAPLLLAAAVDFADLQKSPAPPQLKTAVITAAAKP